MAAPDTTRNTLRTNQGTNEDDSQSDPHPEVCVSQSQTTKSGPDDTCDSALGQMNLRPDAFSAAKHMLFERHQGHIQSLTSLTHNCQQKVLASIASITGVQQTAL